MLQSADLFQDLKIAMPEVATAIFAMWALVLGVMKRQQAFAMVTFLSCVFTLGVIAVCFGIFGHYDQPVEAFGGLYVQDYFALAMKMLVAAGVFVSLVYVYFDMKQTQIGRFEAPILMILSMLGMFFMLSANDLLTVYVGLELQSLALYVLASFNRHSYRAPEAGMKYFILGAIASGMLLFGMSFVYGFAGHTGFSVLADAVHAGGHNTGLIVGIAFILAGLAFKISAVPFHMWTPDVYQGAPSSVTAFFAIVPKIAAICLLIRLLDGAFGGLHGQWSQIVWFLSAASMTVGAFAGLVQNNIKRLLAYSSIGNMGYALMGVMVAGVDGAASVVVYMSIYMVMTAGVFGVILSLRKSDLAVEDIADLKALSQAHPYHAYAMALFMFSMSGIPPLAGFFSKLMVFKAAVNGGYIGLAVIGVLTSVVASYYYLRIIKVMFFDEEDAGMDEIKAVAYPAQRGVLAISLIGVVGFCLVPMVLIEYARLLVAPLF